MFSFLFCAKKQQKSRKSFVIKFKQEKKHFLWFVHFSFSPKNDHCTTPYFLSLGTLKPADIVSFKIKVLVWQAWRNRLILLPAPIYHSVLSGLHSLRKFRRFGLLLADMPHYHLLSIYKNVEERLLKQELVQLLGPFHHFVHFLPLMRGWLAGATA